MSEELGALPGDAVQMVYSNWTVKEVRLGRKPAVLLEQGAKTLLVSHAEFYRKFKLVPGKGKRRKRLWVST